LFIKWCPVAAMNLDLLEGHFLTINSGNIKCNLIELQVT
jgi:hypothetical protein